MSTDRHLKVDAQTLTECFLIGLKKAEATMKVKTQKGMRSALLPLSRRYRAYRQYGIKRLNSKFATDTCYFTTKSLHQNIGAQIFSNKCGFAVNYNIPKANGNNVGSALLSFINEYCAMLHLTFDGVAVQKGSKTKFINAIRKH